MLHHQCLRDMPSSRKIETLGGSSRYGLQFLNSCICIMGDFNSVRRTTKRVGNGEIVNNRYLRLFDEFIRDSGLIHLPLHGKLFTWFTSDETCKSRIDRALINNSWLLQWPSSHHRVLDRSLSNHCPITLEIKVKDWDTNPFKSYILGGLIPASVIL